MLCPDCHTYAADDEIVCPRCGKLLEKGGTEEEELMRFRQGRHLRIEEAELPPEPVIGTHGASRSFEDTKPMDTAMMSGAYYGRRETLAGTGHIYGMEAEGADMPLAYGMNAASPITPTRRGNARSRKLKMHRRAVNMVYVGIACIVLVLGAMVGAYVYLMNTQNGQVIMARMGQDATSAAMWQVGDELFRTGDIEGAIGYYTTARQKDFEAEAPNVSGLLQLGSAYEANDQLELAEEVYAYIYNDVVPEAAEAYRSQVRVLLNQGREAEAAVLLNTAYQKTGMVAFRTQRLEILPTVPHTSVTPGYYTAAQTVGLIQPQDHQVYYSFDPFAELPANGILYTGPIELGEGEHELRAVAVNGDLISDPMKVAFQIYLPTPLQPDCNLAPGTYQKKRKVILRKGKLSDEELVKNPGYAATLDDPVAQTITMYYTIDGSQPDKDSPIWDGTEIQLPAGGYVTLKAVSVNGYGKQGNTMERTFKFDCAPYFKEIYNVQDLVDDLKLGATTREAFWGKYGEGTGPSRVQLNTVEDECERYTYPWGHATFMKQKSGWVLAEVEFTSTLTGPRGTKNGMSEEDITKQFKDFGQVVGATGVKRGLYYEAEDEQGAISIQASGARTIYYRTGTADGHTWQLEYHINASNQCTSIRWVYER